VEAGERWNEKQTATVNTRTQPAWRGSWGNWKRQTLDARTQGRKQWKMVAALLVPDVTASNGCGQINHARVKDCQLLLTVVGHLNWMRNYLVLCRCGHTDIFLHVGQLVAIQYHTAECDFGSQIRCREWLRTGDDEIECRPVLWLQRGPVFGAADNPLGRLPDHFALVVHEKANGAGGFHRLG
jgi:hypothetical protein